MENEIMLPDYNNSILNLIVSILKHYNVESKYNTIEQIDKLLQKNYNNVVLLILDGMGENIMKVNSPNGLFSKNKLTNVTSVYPSTTTAAMNTYYSGKPPIETGWIAWTQYFKEYGKNINVLPGKDDTTGEKINVKNKGIFDIIGYETIYSQIEKQNKEMTVCEIMPSYCEKRADLTISCDNIEQICKSIVTLCKSKNSNFLLAYSDNPDSIIHKHGCYSEETKNFILEAEKNIESMIKQLEGTNTLLLISADHGHNDIKEAISILDLEEINDCLIMPPSFESRCVTFWVKEDRKSEFEKLFKNKFEGKYKLYKKKEFIESNLIGEGEKHKKVDDFIGDYVAIAISDTVIILENYLSKELNKPYNKKSTHCGLTKNEMNVPIIAFEII